MRYWRWEKLWDQGTPVSRLCIVLSIYYLFLLEQYVSLLHLFCYFNHYCAVKFLKVLTSTSRGVRFTAVPKGVSQLFWQKAGSGVGTRIRAWSSIWHWVRTIHSASFSTRELLAVVETERASWGCRNWSPTHFQIEGQAACQPSPTERLRLITYFCVFKNL